MAAGNQENRDHPGPPSCLEPIKGRERTVWDTVPSGPVREQGQHSILAQQFPDEMREFANAEKSSRVFEKGWGESRGWRVD